MTELSPKQTPELNLAEVTQVVEVEAAPGTYEVFDKAGQLIEISYGEEA